MPSHTTSNRRARVEPGSLTSAAGAADLFPRYPMYQQGLDWLEQFVVRPHPDLGRPGAVCPRLAPAMRADTVRLVAIALTGTSFEHAVEAGYVLGQLFDELTPDADRQSAALLGFFPGLPAQDAADFIDGGHRLARPWFVERGLMLGEFHPTSAVGSVHNPDLPVMRCPAPMFAVRAITPHDLMFLDQPDTPLSDRLIYLDAFRRHVGARLSPAAKAGLQTRITEVRAALNSGESS
ncbi:DUF6875 domain-containing protein [Micromonospora sp. NPDC005324]|uniref:DUF6875 domain-containing protein n=1 Tax=Micromonospora sp. NPDC005324 TaxID=3157033 RepID=UPI0033B4DAAA